MNGSSGVEILRAAIFHTPKNPFVHAGGLVCFADGGLAISGGRIARCGDYADIRAEHPDAAVRDLRGGYILPGLIDTHVHFPQVRILGGLGCTLLDWLDRLALPEEARLSDAAYAIEVAHEFINGLVSHGTTCALAFGSHFPEATAALFEAAARTGLRLYAGLVLSDRMLRPDLHQTPQAAYRDSKTLISRFHGKDRLGYAVTPRFAVSSSEPMLEVCRTLLRENSGLRFTTHINENPDEIQRVSQLFPWAQDYLGVYEKFDLIGRTSVLAHNVHSSATEPQRLAIHGASIAHCPSSNAALGSGIFPLRRHLEARVHFALGTDVGGGTGFGMMKEALQAYLMQRVAAEPVTLDAAQMLYLATRAGAESIGIEPETGDFESGKSADLVYLRPPKASVLAAVLATAETPFRILEALFTLAGSESVREVRIEGELVFEGGPYDNR